MKRGYSSAGRALAWHARGQRFDPAYLHHPAGSYNAVTADRIDAVPFIEDEDDDAFEDEIITPKDDE